MQAQQTAPGRLLRYDAGLLFLWCWLLGLGFSFATGHPDIPNSLGAGAGLFVVGLIALLISRHSPNRYRIAVLAATAGFALAMFGVWGALRA